MGETRDVVAAMNEAFNAHDADRIRSHYANSAVFTAPGDVRLEGPEAITDYAMSWLNAFPDAQLIVHQTLVDGNWAAYLFTFEGTHADTLTGPQGDIPATNRHLSGRGNSIVRIEGGKIVEENLYFDQVQLLTQLGLMPEPAATG